MNALTQSTLASPSPIPPHLLSDGQLVVLFLALLAYAGTFWPLLAQLLSQRTPKHLASLVLLFIGLSLHAYILLPDLITPYGVDFNLFNVLSLTSWLMLTLSFFFSTYRPVIALNLLAIPVATAGLLAGALWQAPYQPLTQIGHGLEWHIVFSLAAYCVLLMAAIQAILLKVQIRELKHTSERRIWVKMLPPLQTMESLLFDMLLLGFVLLTGALWLGAISVDNMMAQHLVHKTVFSVLSWLIFGILLIGRWRMGWRGPRAVTFTLWGFAFLLLGFLGSKFVLEVVLKIS